MKNISLKKILVIFLLSKPAFCNDGIWTGVFDINGHGVYDFTGLINDNKTTAYTEKAKVVYDGTIETNTNNEFIWNLSMYLKDGSFFGTAEIKGKIIDGKIMSGKWSTEPAKDFGNIYLKKNNISNKSTINHNKKWVSINSKVKHSFVINNNKILGKDGNGCNYYGDLKKLNNNIYSLNIEIASCGISDGNYVGMTHIDEENNLIINATNKNFSLFLKFK